MAICAWLLEVEVRFRTIRISHLESQLDDGWFLARFFSSPSSLVSPLRLGSIATVGSPTALPNTREPSSRINFLGLFGRLCCGLGRLVGSCTGLVGFRGGEGATQARGRYEDESGGRG